MSTQTARTARLLVFGVLLVWLELAVFGQLGFSLSADALAAKDWPLHLVNAIALDDLGPDPGAVLGWYRDTEFPLLHYPPLGYAPGIVVGRATGLDRLAATYAGNAVWLAILVLALFDAGRRIGGGVVAGLAAAAVGGLSVAAVDESLTVNLSFATTAAVAAGFWALIAFDPVRGAAASLACGAALGVCALVSPRTVPFLAPAFFVLVVLGAERGRALSVAARFAAAIVGFLPAAGWFYGPMALRVLDDAGGHSAAGAADAVANLRFYAGVVSPNVLAPAVIAAVAGVFVLGAVRRDRTVCALGAGGLVGAAFLLGLNLHATEYLWGFQVIAALAIARGLTLVPARVGTAVAAVLIVSQMISATPVYRRVVLRPAVRAACRCVVPGTDGATRAFTGQRPIAGFSWAAIRDLGTALERYAEPIGRRDLGVIDAAGTANLLVPALALARRGTPRLVTTPANFYVNMPYEPDPANRAERLAKKSRARVVVLVAPDPPETGDPALVAELDAVRDVVSRLRRLDLVLALPGVRPRLPSDVRVEFYVDDSPPAARPR